MRQRLFVALLVLITAAYCWGLGWIAWGFSRAGGAIGWGLALGVVILLALTVWVTWRELLFGMASGRLARAYEPPEEPLPDAREEFERARRRVQESSPQRWQDWFRLALAYDALRDRRGARMATRRAIAAAR